MRKFGLFAFGFMLSVNPAWALCSYDGVDNAKTTVAQEYADSRWVAKVRILSGKDRFSKPEENVDSYSTYRLRIIEVFKGKPPALVTFFSTRDSGGFYFTNAVGAPDVGGTYLVFLNPNSPYKGQPKAERGTVFVNYACGQSKPWSEVKAGELRWLTQHKPKS